MEGKVRREGWEGRLDGKVRREDWERRLEGKIGREEWKRRLGGKIGGKDGREDWKGRLGGKVGRDCWKGRLEVLAGSGKEVVASDWFFERFWHVFALFLLGWFWKVLGRRGWPEVGYVRFWYVLGRF